MQAADCEHFRRNPQGYVELMQHQGQPCPPNWIRAGGMLAFCYPTYDTSDFGEGIFNGQSYDPVAAWEVHCGMVDPVSAAQTAAENMPDLSLGNMLKSAGIAVIVVGGTVIAGIGVSATPEVIISGIGALFEAPFWVKMAALGGGTAFVADTTLQAVNNMNQCGMDVFTAFYHENIDWAQVKRSTISGVLMGLSPSVWRFWGALGGWGLTGLGTQSVAAGALSAAGYVLGLMAANNQEGKPLLEGLDVFSASSNLFFGSVYGGLWGVPGKINPAQTFAEAALPMTVLGVVAAFIQTAFNTAIEPENATPEGIALGIGGGAGNIYSATNQIWGYAAILFLTAIFAELSKQSAE